MESHRNLYTEIELYCNPGQYLRPVQHDMADMSFAWEGELVLPYYRNESTAWICRAEHNRHIGKKRMTTEWRLGYANNRYILFLVKWPLSPDLFLIAHKTAAVLSNCQLAWRGYALQTLNSYEEKIARTERTDSY